MSFKIIPNVNLTKNFRLYEFLDSDRAVKCGGQMFDKQYDFSNEIALNIEFVAEKLQIPRTDIDCPLNIGSGYRNPLLNIEVKGSSTSFHLIGLGGDISIDDAYMERKEYKPSREVIDLVSLLHTVADKQMPECNANYILFVYCCINRHALNLVEIIHTNGTKFNPSFIHLSFSRDKEVLPCEIMVKEKGKDYDLISLRQVLAMDF